MRKILLAAVLLLLLVSALGGCQEQETEKAFVAPYDMSQDQQELLSLLGLEDAALVFSFKAPEEAAKVTAHTYVLEDGVWVENGGVSLLREGGGQPAPCRGVRPGLSPGPQHGPAPERSGPGVLFQRSGVL